MLITALLLLAQDASVAQYRVEFASEAMLRPRVSAQFHVDDGRLMVATGGGIDHVDGQWASFIRDLKVRDAAGAELPVESAGRSGWRIADYEGKVSLDYEVDLAFTTKPWPPGNEQAGLYRDADLYVVTKPLFVAPSSFDRAVVRFVLPDGLSVATPWHSDTGGYRVDSVAELTENSLVVSRRPPATVTRGEMTLVLATLGLPDEAHADVTTTLTAAMDRVAEIFPGIPRSRYLMTVLYGGPDDGESFESSAAFTTATLPRADNRMLWGNNLAHELFHIWIGGRIHAEDSSFEWFDEGVTDYYADSALRRAGLISSGQYLQKMEKVMGRYGYYVWSSLYPKQSLAAAGANKGRYRFGVYDGGWAAAFCLDVMLRGAPNQGGLDDVMGALYAQFGRPGVPFDRRSLVSVVNEVGGADLTPFFDAHIFGAQPLPLERCLADAGLEGAFQPYAAELWISKAPAPSAEALARRNGLIGF